MEETSFVEEKDRAEGEICVSVSGDALFPREYKTYADFINELSGEDVYAGLVSQGMLGDKLPPVLTSEPFFSYCRAKSHNFSGARHGWISYRYARNVGRYREYGIPCPFGYELLSRAIADHWDEIAAILSENTEGQAYKISRIHPRKQSENRRIFEMGYKQWWADAEPLPAILIGRRFVVNCDVSRCFPSIYTHAIDWAIRGRKSSKARCREKSWAHELDDKTSAITHGETHGLLVGPHSSNIQAELVMTTVDKNLYRRGYRFVRNIDDYICYTETRDEADEFVVELEKELARFRLSLNQQKTVIAELPNAVTQDWVHALRGFRFTGHPRLHYKDVESFLDTAVSLMGESGGNQSVLLYAIKMLSGKKLKSSARKYFADMASHLTCLYPYLVPSFEASVIVPTSMSEERIRAVAEILYSQAMAKRDYLTACYALYYGAKYKFRLDGVKADSALFSGDCLLMLFALLYTQENSVEDLRMALVEHAEQLAADTDDEVFDRYWLFAYEALPAEKLPDGDWRAIKKAGVSFVDLSKMEKPDFSADVARAEVEELLAIEADDHGEDYPSADDENEL